MKMEDVARVRATLFREKRAQLEALLDIPLLLYWGKWEGPNIRALTLAEEFTRPTFFLCLPGGATVAVAQSIETDQLSALADDVEVIPYKTFTDLQDALGARLRGVRKIAVEISDEFFAFDRLPPHYLKFLASYAELKPADEVLVPFRGVKSATELELMKEAAIRTMAVFARLEKMVVLGTREEDIVTFLEREAIDAGGKPSFFPIVASGPRSANPHPARRAGKTIGRGERVIVDYGVDYLGYKADITRTYIAGGKPEDDPFYDISVRLHEMVQKADLGAMSPYDLGSAAARMVGEAGLAEFERHGYGHGLGVETHDPHPYVVAEQTRWTDKPFADGMVFTFEPGFYDARGGFRLENDYVVGKGRAVKVEEWRG